MAKYDAEKVRKLISPEITMSAFIDYDDGDNQRLFCELRLALDADLDCLLGGIGKEKYDKEYNPIVEPRGLPNEISGTVFDAVLKVSGSVIVRKPKIIHNPVWGENAKAIFDPYGMKIANNVLSVSYLESSEVEEVITRYERLTGKTNSEILAIYASMVALDAGTPGISRFIFWYK